MRFYNTLTRQKEEFKPLNEGKIGIYSCGPTVYDYPHVGNLRSYIFADTLNRLFRYYGYEVKHLINITDVGHLTSDADTGEDKIEAQAKKTGQLVEEMINKYTEVFFDNLRDLNISEENYQFPKATEHINEQIDLIQKLTDKGYTYELADGVYFDTSLYPNYKELGKIPLDQLKINDRIEIAAGKKNPADFALWKFSKPTDKRLQEWSSPWGVGFPGWHIECSAMSMKYLGEHFDIHTGGIDHIPVHHTNERAQSECATDHPFVNYWMHNAFLINDDNSKMSKSSGSFTILADLISDGFSPLDFRYLVMGVHYRKELKFSSEALTAAKNARQKLNRFLNQITDTGEIVESYKEKFIASLDDDLNTPAGLAVIWELIADRTISNGNKKTTILEFDQILGLDLKNQIIEEIPAEINALVEERETARKTNDWKKADELRVKIQEQGFMVEDSENGPVVHK